MVLRVNAVAFQEGELWIVQGVEYDICARAKSMLDAPKAFERAVIENLALCDHLGREPFEGIEPAPAEFRELFERGGVMDAQPIDHVQNGERPRPDVNVRFTELAA